MSRDGVGGLLPPADEAGLYLVPVKDVGPLSRAAAALRIPCLHVDLRDCVTKADFLDRLSAALGLPARVGRNWDALADALGDLRDPGAPGLVLLLSNSERMRTGSGDEFQTAMEVLESASAEWAARGGALWVFVALPPGEYDGAG